ncbi:MAG: hypothetical protein HRU35_07410 [Rickettsiaceae bacterium]|nr:hypothetical protein [Rickettsiaceae bacterium]
MSDCLAEELVVLKNIENLNCGEDWNPDKAALLLNNIWPNLKDFEIKVYDDDGKKFLLNNNIKNNNLDSLKISTRKKPSEEEKQSLGNFLLKCKSLKKIKLDINSLDSKNSIKIFRSLPKDIEVMELSNNNLAFDKSNLKEIFKFQKLKCLTLNSNNLSKESIKLLATNIHKLSDLEELSITNNEIQDESFIYLLKGILKLQQLKYLSVSNNKIGDESILKLRQNLENNKKLNKLCLSNNGITKESLGVLFVNLRYISNIEYLDVSNNSFSENDIRGLITQLPNLKEIKFKKDIRDSDNKIITEYVKDDVALKMIKDKDFFILTDMSYNSIIEDNDFIFKSKFFLDLGEYKKAVDLLNDGLKKHPKNCNLYALKGYVQYKLQEFEESIESLNFALEINPVFSFAHSIKGSSLHELKKYDEAVNCFNEALKSSFFCRQENLNNKACALILSNKKQEALKVFDKLSDEFYLANLNAAKLYYQLNKYQESANKLFSIYHGYNQKGSFFYFFKNRILIDFWLINSYAKIADYGKLSSFWNKYLDTIKYEKNNKKLKKEATEILEKYSPEAYSYIKIEELNLKKRYREALKCCDHLLNKAQSNAEL